MKPNSKEFKYLEAIVFEPSWYQAFAPYSHPLNYGQMVYYMGEIPNVPGHCVVATYESKVVPMVYPDDFRKAKEKEL
jgi:hypothetical protein